MVDLQLTTKPHINRFGQEQKCTALWSYSTQAYVCPTPCPSNNSAIKNAWAYWQIWIQRNVIHISYISFVSVFCVCNRIIKGSQNFDGLISSIIKFSSITQIHYSTHFNSKLHKNILSINQNVSIGSSFNISASVFIMIFFMERKRKLFKSIMTQEQHRILKYTSMENTTEKCFV